jgi:hypothetical protein
MLNQNVFIEKRVSKTLQFIGNVYNLKNQLIYFMIFLYLHVSLIGFTLIK